MKIDQAKRIPLETILEHWGHTPQRRAREQLWYLSPFRAENTPSFKVNPALNLWYDFGDGRHGDALDLVQELDGLPSVAATLRRLEAWNELPPVAPPPRVNKTDTSGEPALKLLRVGPVRSRALRHYLAQRGIDPQLAGSYVQEAHYESGGRERFALAFANDRGGYELRNPFSQLTLGRKAVTTLAGDSDRILVFEGFFDFLSYVARHGRPSAKVLVLNSVSLAGQAIEKLKPLAPRVIELYRDRDEAGLKLLKKFREELPETQIVDRAELYEGYNDLNAWHQDHVEKRTVAR